MNDGELSLDRYNIREYLVPVDGFTTAVKASGQYDTIFVSGLTARLADGSVDKVGDAAGQARVLLTSLKRILEARGAGLEHVVRIVTYLVDIRDHHAVHQVRREFFGDEPPASTSVQVVALYDERQLIEIEATALVPVRSADA